MSENHSGRFRRLAWTIAGSLALVTAIPLAVIAAHSFNDVPDSNEFHGSIEWLKDNGVTVGCNPPANTEFCPDDNIPREQMASFMRRFAQTFGTAGANVTDPTDIVDTTGVTFVELSTLEATPVAEAEVVLNAHVTLSKDATVEGTYEVIIARDSCEGTVLGSAGWLGAVNTEAVTETDTISLTASDVVSATTTYVVCAAESDDVDPTATASTRGLTASWVPTS
ncbi:MAG TPA: S-layer homology domain-containing protein [Acidimicrobiia bacterium]|nr:S-layer homology domain-containing protein [Acidimicrobiia bacterium]